MEVKKKNLFKTKKALYCFVLFVIVGFMLFCSIINSYAYTSSYEGKNDYDTSGGFYFELNGGSSGNSRIHFIFRRKSGATSYSSMMNSPSTWAVSMGSSTNNHNIQIVDTSITTKLDVTNSYNVLSFRISYDMPAHYQYSSSSDDSPSGMRFNMANYSYNGDGANSAAASGGHSTSTTRRAVNIQVNTGNTGLRTYNKYWYYNCTLRLNIAKTSRTVTQYHYYQTTSGWTHFNTTSNGKTDSDWFSPYNVSAPNGYHPGNNYGYYSSGGAYLGDGTVGSNGFTVCDNNTVNVHYYPNTYYVYYNANGGSGAPPTQAFTYNWGASISSTVPTRVGYTFTGWDYNGVHFNPGQAIPHGWGSFTLNAQWKINSYTATFNSNGGTTPSPTSIVKNYGTALGTLPTTTRIGYTFAGWWTTVNGGTQITTTTIMPSNNVTYYAHWANSDPIINCPVIGSIVDQNEIKPFISKQMLIIQKGDKFTPLYYATANDKEDGDLTNRIKVVSNNVNTAISNTYKVIYSVSDTGGKTVTKEMTVIVNDPPELVAPERNFLLNKNVDIKELIKKATSNDKEDGDLISAIKVSQIKYNENNIVLEPTSFMTDKVGVYVVSITVTDHYKKSVSKDFTVNIVEDIYVSGKEYKIATRFISKKYIGTLSNASIWKRNNDYYNTLISSLNRNKPIISYTFGLNDIKQSKEYTKMHKPSSTSNKQYSEMFSHTKGG